MLTEHGVISRVPDYSSIGSENNDRQFGYTSLLFVPVYPTSGDDTASFKVWEIHYPPDIKTDSKYLETGSPEIDKELQL